MIQSPKRQTKSLTSLEVPIELAITRIAESDCPVLLAGEHGVGKRHVAEQIHLQSPRSRGVYKEIHCTRFTI
jgi:DNA-binding NtrC family response regulator